MLQLKVCKICHIEKPITDFGKSGNRNGIQYFKTYCKSCSKIYRQENREKLRISYKKCYEKNKEKILKKHKEWYNKNKEKYLEYTKQYRKAHPEIYRKVNKEYSKTPKRKEYLKNYQQLNKDYIQKYMQKYNYEHEKILKTKEYRKSYNNSLIGKTKSAARHYKREILKKNGDIDAGIAEYRTILSNKDNKECYWCGKPINKGESYHIDHIIPISRGGGEIISNLAISCPSCNISKRDKYPWEYQKYKLTFKEHINNKFKIKDNMMQSTIL